tara:strand:- start:86 stop:844 length:759 start_codon:yes stop_codon:yes gene_type:complete
MKLILFDVDGTLTPARKIIEESMLKCLQELKNNPNLHIGFVGGSDLDKQKEQLKEENFHIFDWRFSENGLLAYKDQECIHKRSFTNSLTEKHFKQLINICLYVLSTLDCPVKRGTFIENRTGMINVSPIGRSCNQKERIEFEEYDKKNKVRENMILKIKERWSEYLTSNNIKDLPEIQFSIGGQISVDVFPKGWDKTYCLQFVEDKYDEIHFFGDKTHKGGNDYEIFKDSRVIGHKVEKYNDTIEILNRDFI